MNLHLFCSARYPNVFGLTESETGANLPSAYAPWEPFDDKGMFSVEARRKSMDRLLEPVIEAVKLRGYYVGTIPQ